MRTRKEVKKKLDEEEQAYDVEWNIEDRHYYYGVTEALKWVLGE